VDAQLDDVAEKRDAAQTTRSHADIVEGLADAEKQKRQQARADEP
jgi:hypothetical protein